MHYLKRAVLKTLILYASLLVIFLGIKGSVFLLDLGRPTSLPPSSPKEKEAEAIFRELSAKAGLVEARLYFFDGSGLTSGHHASPRDNAVWLRKDLNEDMSKDALASVIAHELGHLATYEASGIEEVNNDFIKWLFLSFLWLPWFYAVEKNKRLYGTFGFQLIASVLILAMVQSSVTREAERSADRYGAGLIGKDAMRRGLSEFLTEDDNAGIPFLRSHPGKVERLRALEDGMAGVGGA